MTTLPPGYDGPSLRSLAAGVDTDGPGMTVTSPLTGEPVGVVPTSTPADVREAADRAREAGGAWAARPVADRVAAIRRFLDLVERRQERLLDLVQLESGKSRHDAAEEILDVRQTGGYYAARAPDLLATDRHRGVVPVLTRVTEHRHPYGVVGFITPWNYPLTLAVSDAVPALLAGNAVLIKPAETTPFTALYAAQLLREAGVPAGCTQVLPGDGELLGESLVGAVDCVSFTGSTAVGREVAALAGEHLVPATLELGGTGPMLVRADAPLGRTVAGAVSGGYASAGQLCVATERIYVHESRYEPFRERLVAAVRGLDLGTALDYGADVGPLISPEHRETVASHVDDAVGQGATLLTGGRERDDVAPSAYEPTVLTDVPADAPVATEETFGPVVTVTPVADDEEAVSRANSSRYGLHGSVWTGDPAAGRELASRVECGSMCVNDAYISVWASTAAPIGGRKESGVGRRHGRQGFETYTDTQSVAVQRGYPVVSPPGVPNRLTAGALSLYARLRDRLR